MENSFVVMLLIILLSAYISTTSSELHVTSPRINKLLNSDLTISVLPIYFDGGSVTFTWSQYNLIETATLTLTSLLDNSITTISVTDNGTYTMYTFADFYWSYYEVNITNSTGTATSIFGYFIENSGSVTSPNSSTLVTYYTNSTNVLVE